MAMAMEKKAELKLDDECCNSVDGCKRTKCKRGQGKSAEESELVLDSSGRILVDGVINYSFRSFPNAFGFLKDDDSAMLAVKKDCEMAFTVKAQLGNGEYSEGHTFFLGANERPRCTLEKIVKEIFEFHSKGATYDPERSGAEWWTLFIEDNDDVGFHFDKDYGMEGHGINLYPHIGTVTYLSDIGGSTLMFEKPGPLVYGGELTGEIDRAFLSFPRFGKHVCFDGRYLHAAPTDIRDLWQSQMVYGDDAACGGSDIEEAVLSAPPVSTVPSLKEKKSKKRDLVETPRDNASKQKGRKGLALSKKQEKKYSTRRVTLLVNIWLNWKPSLAESFPSNKVRRLSNLMVPHNLHNTLQPGGWFEEEIPPVLSVGQKSTEKPGQSKRRSTNNTGGKQKNKEATTTSSNKIITWDFSGENAEEHTVTAPVPVCLPTEYASRDSFFLHFQDGLKAFVD